MKNYKKSFCCQSKGNLHDQIEKVQPLDSVQRIPLLTHTRGASDNPPKCPIENCQDAIRKCVTFNCIHNPHLNPAY